MSSGNDSIRLTVTLINVTHTHTRTLQHDILWNDLTAQEHMELFAGMKGIPRGSIKKEILQLLEQVQLNHVSYNVRDSVCHVMWCRLLIIVLVLSVEE